MKPETIVVVAGGHPLGSAGARRCPHGAMVIAADGGVDRALALGLHVDLAIGDFDSVSAAGLAAAEAAGARVERHPTAKDATDLELALDAAIALAPARILVVGSGGGRLDHLLGSVLLLARRALRSGRDRRVSRRRAASPSSAATRTLAGTPGDLLTLLPVHGAGRRRHDRRARVPAARRDAAAGHEPRRLERLRGPRGPHHGRARLPARGPPRPETRGILVTTCHRLGVALAVVASLLVAGCGGSGDSSASKEVVLVTHDSFVIPKEVKAAFEQESGLTLKILQGGDAGETVNRALLTKGNPQGDVLFGIDNNLLSRALDERLFEPYEAKGLDEVDGAYVLDPDASRDADRPRRRLPQRRPEVVRRRAGSRRRRSLDDLTAPRYRKLLVVENPATSTPGLAFMLATIARFGEERLAGLLARAARERRARRRRLGGGVHAALLGRRRQQGEPADRRLLRDEPGGGGDLRREASHDGADGGRRSELLPADRARGRARRREERRRRPRPDRLHALRALPGGAAREHVRAPGTRRARRCPTRSDATPSRRPQPLELPAGEIGANRDRWIDEWTQTVLR